MHKTIVLRTALLSLALCGLSATLTQAQAAPVVAQPGSPTAASKPEAKPEAKPTTPVQPVMPAPPATSAPTVADTNTEAAPSEPPAASPAPEGWVERTPTPAVAPAPAPATAPASAPASAPAPIPTPITTTALRVKPAPEPAKTDDIEIHADFQTRARAEAAIEPYFYSGGVPGVGQDVDLIRSRIRAGVRATRGVLSIVARVQDVRAFGQGALGENDGSLTGLHEGYVQLQDGDEYLRVGRQELSFGDQRMIGASEWSMAGRSFDALRGHTGKKLSLDAVFAITRMQRTVTDAMGLDQRTVGDFFGALYATCLESDALSADLYVLYRSDGPTETDLLRDRTVVAPGARLFGKLGEQLAYSLEAVYQGGRVASTARPKHRQQAGAVALDVGWTPEAHVTASVGGSVASGDSGGSAWTEFDNFFPTNHRFYGHADLFGLRNLREEYLKLMLRAPEQHVQAEFAGHLFSLANGEARWSDAGGRTLGQSSVRGSSLLGGELDFTARWEPPALVFLEAGYAGFVPAKGAKRLGHPDPTHLVYLMLGAKLP